MRYLLDTNTCIYYLNAPVPTGLVERFRNLGPDALALSAITVAELAFGAERSSRAAANRRRVALLTAELRCLPFDERCAERFGGLKASLQASGVSLADFDAAIVATAQVHGLTLVSHDQALLAVPGLDLEDWVQEA